MKKECKLSYLILLTLLIGLFLSVSSVSAENLDIVANKGVSNVVLDDISSSEFNDEFIDCSHDLSNSKYISSDNEFSSNLANDEDFGSDLANDEDFGSDLANDEDFGSDLANDEDFGSDLGLGINLDDSNLSSSVSNYGSDLIKGDNYDLNNDSVFAFNSMEDDVSIYTSNNLWYVGQNITENGTGSIADPFSNLNFALNNASFNDIILINEGTYSGIGTNVNLTVNIENLTIQAVDGANVIFDAQNLSRIFNITASGVCLNNLSFINSNDSSGGSCYISGNFSEINGCSFNNSNASVGGGVLFITGNFTKILNSNFTNSYYSIYGSSSSSNLIINNSIFNNCYGNIVYIGGKNVTMTNSEFNNCLSNVLYCYSIGGSSIDDCVLLNLTFNNSYGCDLGGIHSGLISNLTFFNGSGSINFGFTDCDNMTISNISVDSWNSGTFTLNSPSKLNLTIDNINLTNSKNMSFNLFFSYYVPISNLLISNNVVTNNRLFYTSGSSLSFENVTFVNNVVNSNLFYVSGSYFSFDNMTFVNNIGNSTLFYARGSYFSSENLTLVNNTIYTSVLASETDICFFYGGGSIFNHVIVDNNRLFDSFENTVKSFAVVGTGIKNTVANSSFSNNYLYSSAGENSTYSALAGGLQIYGTAYNCSFLNNVVESANNKSHGGALCFRPGSLVYNCTFVNNTADYGGATTFHADGVLENCTFINNTARKVGGAISTGYDNTSQSVNLTNCYLEGNSAQSGGALYAIGDNITFKNSSFVNNTAKGGNNYSSEGGAFYILGSDTSLVNCNLSGNNAEFGGAGYINGSNVLINSNDISNNTADNAGAVFINGLNATIINSNIVNNNASVNGGAIYINGSNATISNVSFAYNNALISAGKLDEGLGGALFMQGNGTLVKDSVFTHNTARNGSAIYNGGINMHINTTQFADNQAGIYWIPTFHNDTHIYSTLYGGNTILNAIYNGANFSDIFIDGKNPVDGAENSLNGTVPYQDGREANQTIVTTVYDKAGNLVYNGTEITDLYGAVSYPFTSSMETWYIVHMTHLEDTYYKAITNTTALNVEAGINIADVSMYENDPNPQTIYSVLVNQLKNIIINASNVSVFVKVNGSYVYLGSKSTDNNGLAIFNESTVFKTLAPGKYELFANYSNADGKYEVCNVTGTLNVLPLFYHINKTVINGDNVSVGDILEFNISVVNDGNATIHNIITIDLNMPGLEAIINESYPDWEYIGNNSWIYDGDIAPYENISFIPKFLIIGAGNLTNMATVIVNNGTGSNITNVTFNASKSPTNTTIDNPIISGHVGDNVTTNCTVLDKNGGAVRSGSVELIVDGVVVGTATVVDGHVSINWTILANLKPGDYEIIANYLGDDNYYPSNGTGFVNVVKLATNITIDNPVISGHVGDNVTTNCTVLDENGEPVKSGSVELIVDGVVVGTAIVVDGHVSINWTILANLKPGDYEIIVNYLGDDNYYPSSTHNETVLVNGTNQTMDGNLTVLNNKTPVNPNSTNPSNSSNSINLNNHNSNGVLSSDLATGNDSGLAMENTGNPLAMLLLALLVLFVARIKPKF